MKTLLTRIKQLIANDPPLVAMGVREVQICPPDTLPDVSNTRVPWIGVAPLSTQEGWVAQRKEVTHGVAIYSFTFVEEFEKTVIGDTASGKPGLIEVVNALETALRNQLYSGYLSKPTEINGIVYQVQQYGDGIYGFVATITLECVRLVDVSIPTT